MFTNNDFSNLPTVIRRYIKECGYIGKHKMSYLKNGIKQPTKFKAVWNYPDEDFVYFDGVIDEVSYGWAQ